MVSAQCAPEVGARAGAMTPEHVSELQNILRFLRANAFEKSEAALGR
jgi:hypothetical protein